MRVLFISDIHGNCSNLDYINKVIKTVDKVIILGDLGSESEGVLNFISNISKDLIMMRGNNDDSCQLDLIDDYINFKLDDNNVILTHGDLYNHEEEMEFSDSVVIMGHYHKPFVIKKNSNTFICVGSISFPRGSVISYAIYENDEIIIYDLEENIITEYRL